MKHDSQSQPPLSDDDVERYGRQVIVPGVGAAGQAKLLAATVAIAGDPAGVAQASRYLAAAGIRVIAYTGHEDADCYVLAGIDEVEKQLRQALIARQAPLAWYAIDGSNITSGSGYASADARAARPARPDPNSAPVASADLHAVAACDAAAVALALVLGWNDLESETELKLA